MEEKRMIEGRRPVIEALRAGTEITCIILQKGSRGKPVDDILALAKEYSVNVEYWDKAALDKRAHTRNHQGVMAETPPFQYTPFADILAKTDDEPLFLVVLDHIQDPHNLGALIRTAYAAGCHGIIIPERRAAQMTPAAVRTAAGAAEYLPVAQVVNLARCLDECKDAGLWVYGADMDGESVYTAGDYKVGTVLVVGSEGEGLGRLIKEKCDHIVQVPMRGKVASLNASVAGALFMYEVYRQREGF